jgi:phosphoribosylglycinamide formyltransferase 1
VKERLAVFASGGGSNLQSLLDRFQHHDRIEVALVVSDREDAGALRRAEAAGVPARVIAVRGRSPDDVAGDTLRALDEHRVRWIALAGYLRLVPPAVVRAFEGRILNIHPALLPAFGGEGMYGARVHEAVIRAGCTVTGPTVHLVDEEYDRGRILLQWPVPVLPGDDAARLAKRVLAVEHAVYPVVVEWVVGGGGAPDLAVGDSAVFGLGAGPPAEAQIRGLLGGWE